ncbi:MAG TPA: site-specific integrase [Ruminococcus sp.]|nr:site-specific integrase [Ruminococcus sp.]
MATIKKHISKSGKITYHIRAYDGYNSKGKQIEHTMTWKPPENMTEKQMEKEAQKQAVLFEERIRKGTCFDSNTRFAEYAETWLENNRPPLLAPKTYERYKALLKNINAAIGEIKLTKLQSHHLQEFYNNLRENGIKQAGSYAVANDLKSIMKALNINRSELAETAGVSKSTVTAACKTNNHISIESAEKIAKGLNMPLEKVFQVHSETGGLSSKTILHHHRLISTILAQATRDRLIPFNIADRSYMKAPKLEHHEADFLDDEQAKHVLELLDNEPIKWKTAMYLLIFSGMRRGELMGLEWQDIDFDNRVIHIKRTSQYVQHMGIITKSPKNETSYRTVKLSETIFDLLREYQAYWNKLRNDLSDRWQYFIDITLADGSRKSVRNDRLFIKDDSTPMNPDSLTDWTSKFVKKNKLPHFSPHSLRHTHATILIAEGVSIPTVSRRLGHSSIATTSKIYVHAIQSADEIASDIIDDKLNTNTDTKNKCKT